MQLPYFDPVIFSFWGFSLHWYGLAWAMSGLYVALAMRKSVAGYAWITPSQAENISLYGFIGLLIGGRLGYSLFYGWQQIAQDWIWLFRIWEGGMSFHGGLIGGLFLVWLWCRWQQKSMLAVLDLAAPHIPVALGLVRLANFINGELWGRATDMPWGVVFANDPTGLVRHPSQLYEAFLEGLVLWLFLSWAQKKKDSFDAGFMTGLALVGYAVLRTIAEVYREPDAHIGFDFWNVTRGQWLSIPVLLLGLFLLLRARQRQLNGSK